MDVIVLVKEVIDPDLPPSKFSVDVKTNSVIPPEGIPSVISPYDALAVEAALKIKEELEGTITVVSMGGLSCDAIVRKTLAMGADGGIILSDPLFDLAAGFGAASVLAQAIRKIGRYDLILCGRQAADWDRGVTGPFLAEYLGLPVVSVARSIAVSGRKIRVERVIASGSEMLEMDLPAVVTVSNEMGHPRIPSGWGVIKAARQEIPVWNSHDLQWENLAGPVGEGRLVRLYAASYDRKCEFLTGKEPDEVAAALLDRLRGAGGTSNS